MKKIFSSSVIYNLYLWFLILMILPFTILTIFDQPSADDFYFSEKTMFYGYWNAQLKWYNYWSGRFFSNAVLGVNPLTLRSIFLYKAAILLLMLFLFFFLYYLISQLTGRKLSIKEKIIFSLSFIFLYLYAM